jgi:hypothetical protein
MTDGELLFLILCLIYLTDCVHWSGPGTIVFSKWIGAYWKHQVGFLYFGISNVNFLLLNPLPPLGLITCSYPLPVSISPEGVVSFDALADSNQANRESALFRFDDIDSVAAKSKDTLVNGTPFCRCGSEQQAIALVELLQYIKSLNPGERESAISLFWKKQFDYPAAKERLDSATGRTKTLRSICSLLFVYLFVIAPVCSLIFGISGTLLPVAVALIPLVVIINRGLYVAHKALYPEHSFDRFTNLIKNCLCPPALIRACDHITKDILQDYHPIVIGHILLESGEFINYASEIVRKLKTPPFAGSLDDYGRQIIDWYNQKLIGYTYDYLHNVACIGTQLVLTPALRDPDAKSYCPRCLCQFMQKDGNCPDCIGVKLSLFDETTIGG